MTAQGVTFADSDINKTISALMSTSISKDEKTAAIQPDTESALLVEMVENKIRAHIFAKRIRLTDLFADFDKLRTGYVSASQFRRCVGAAMDRGVVSPMVESEYSILMEHYKGQGSWEGRIKWVSFVDSIDKGKKKGISSKHRIRVADYIS
jgi:hypothetical protein